MNNVIDKESFYHVNNRRDEAGIHFKKIENGLNIYYRKYTELRDM